MTHKPYHSSFIDKPLWRRSSRGNLYLMVAGSPLTLVALRGGKWTFVHDDHFYEQFDCEVDAMVAAEKFWRDEKGRS